MSLGIREGFSEAVTLKLRLKGCINSNQIKGRVKQWQSRHWICMCKGPGVRRRVLNELLMESRDLRSRSGH